MFNAGILAKTRRSSVELVVNGVFAGSSGWTLGDGWSISGGAARKPSTTSAEAIIVNSGVVTKGASYVCSIFINDIGGQSVRIRIGGVNGATRTSPGSYTETIFVPSGAATNEISISATAGSTDVVVSLLSVKSA